MAKQQATMAGSFTIAGISFAQNKVVEGESPVGCTVDLAAAKTGTLTVRTDANTGSLTMAASHGIITGDRLDIYWAGGHRRGMTVGTVATNVVPIDGGAGDDLPTAATAITAMVPVKRPFAFDGDDLQLLAALSPALVKSVFTFVNSSLAELHFIYSPAGGVIHTWFDDNGLTNPVLGVDVAFVYISHGYSTTGSRNLKVAALTN